MAWRDRESVPRCHRAQTKVIDLFMRITLMASILGCSFIYLFSVVVVVVIAHCVSVEKFPILRWFEYYIIRNTHMIDSRMRFKMVQRASKSLLSVITSILKIIKYETQVD